MTANGTMTALLVDPSLFTAPYDAALTEGLVAAGVAPTWAVRPVRRGDQQEIPPEYADQFFYRHIDQATFLPAPLRAVAKGVAHAMGLGKLVLRVLARKPDVVHFQWAVVPPLDALAIRLIGRRCPVVLTVHDTVPFNGERLSLWQRLAFHLPMRLCDRIIVHTEASRRRMLGLGFAAEKISVIPHGPLRLRTAPSMQAESANDHGKRTFVMFGEIKHYKGPDLLIEAVGMLPPEARRQARFIIAGRARMDTSPLVARIAQLGLGDTIELRERRLSELEMADLFAQADCFLFPYRQVDASGVYFLTKSLGKWIIATRVGVFAEDVDEGQQGALVPPENVRALADAIALAISQRPVATSTSSAAAWGDIGRATRQVYQDVRARMHAAPSLRRRGGLRSVMGQE